VVICAPFRTAAGDAVDVYDPADLVDTERMIYDSGEITAGLTDGAMIIEDVIPDEAAAYDGPYVLGVLYVATGSETAGDGLLVSLVSKEDC
jgi:hypothetical protein